MRNLLITIVSFPLLSGCASGQLNYNTLDLASTTDHLLTAQVLHNLGQFIDTETAVPSQVIINGGTATTANTVTPTFTDPYSKAITLGSSIGTTVAATTTSTSSLTSSVVGASKTFGLSASNVATQNWAFEPISDPDQLRRLYALYTFAVAGNENNRAQSNLASDYPIAYLSGANGATKEVDETFMSGPNCVVCKSKQPPPGVYTATCAKSNDGSNYYLREDEHICVRINKRLLPNGSARSRWLLWKALPGASRGDSTPPPQVGDVFLGVDGHYAMYATKGQADRFAQFSLFVAAAAASAPSPSSTTPGAAKTKGATAVPTGIILTP